jgi:hypothetical protein
MRPLLRLFSAALIACAMTRPAAALDQPQDARAAAALTALLTASSLSLNDLRDFASKPWVNGPEPNLWVGAALPLGDDENLIVGVFREEGDRLQLLAHNAGGEALAEEPLWNAWVGLDLIAYRISPDEVAFGVVVSNDYTSTARSSGSGSLQLYRYRNEVLSPIFAAITQRTSYEKNEEGDCREQQKNAPDCDDEETSEELVVVFSPHKTKGFFDLLLRDKNKKSGKSMRYVWTGGQYERAGD